MTDARHEAERAVVAAAREVVRLIVPTATAAVWEMRAGAGPALWRLDDALDLLDETAEEHRRSERSI